MDLRPELAAAVEAAKLEVIAAGRYLGRRQYHVALAGNMSARVSEDLLVCTRHGADKEALGPRDLVLCDLAGRNLDGEGGATSELNMHREACRLRPDVRMVIHSHPPAATAFAATSTPLDQLQLPEMLVSARPRLSRTLCHARQRTAGPESGAVPAPPRRLPARKPRGADARALSPPGGPALASAPEAEVLPRAGAGA